MTRHDDDQRGALALLLAASGPAEHCGTDAAVLLLHDPNPHHAAHVAHRLAHMLVDSVDREDWPEMREELRAELLALSTDDG